VSSDEQIIELLTEIRDDQRRSLERQEQQLQIAREQLDRAREQVAESIDLQKKAMANFRRVSRVAFPGIVVCLGLIAYLVVRYF